MANIEVMARANLWNLTVGQVGLVDDTSPEVAACLDRGLLVVRAADGTWPQPETVVKPGGCGCGH